MMVLEIIGCIVLIIGIALVLHSLYRKQAPLGDVAAEFIIGYGVAILGAIILGIRFLIWFFGRWAD